MKRARKHWTPDEIDTLYRLYPRHGARYAAKRLHRSESAVAQKAHKEALLIGLIPGRMTIPEVADAAGVRAPTVHRAATQAGVIKTWGGRATVPEAWGREYATTLRARVEADSLAGAWYSLADAARELGVFEHTIRNALAGRGSLAHALADATVHLGTKRQRFIHPSSIQTARARLGGTWLDYEQVATTWGCTRSALRRAVRDLGRLAPIVATMRTKHIPNRTGCGKGRIRVFHASDVHARTSDARTALGLPDRKAA